MQVLGFDRVVFIPSVAVTLGQLEASLRRVVKPQCHVTAAQLNPLAATPRQSGSLPPSATRTRALTSCSR